MERPDMPILLVSAKDKDSAAYIISEIIDHRPEDVGSIQIDGSDLDCVWSITNKYYTADVRVHALLDGEMLDAHLADAVEAHVIYLTSDECSKGASAQIMQRRVQAGAAAQVRLAAADTGAEPPSLVAACARARLELVPLRQPAPDASDADSDDERDVRGAARVRAALHAHLWTGLERIPNPDSRVPYGEQEIESSDDEWSEWCEGPTAGGVEGQGEEEFYAALATLPDAASAARQAGGSREERLARAEQLVAAFCRALGTPFN